MDDIVEIQCTPKAGRFLVAKKEILPGTILFYEDPLVIGPKQLTRPLCLGCYQLADVRFRCSKCCWPVCSQKCEESASHKVECTLLAQSFKLPPGPLPRDSLNCCPYYQSITPIRFLLQKHPALDQLESHTEKRANTDLHRAVERNVVQFMKMYLKIDDFSEKEIHEACGRLDVNSFDVPLENDVRLRAIYPKGSLINHNCLPNARPVITNDFKLKVISVIGIKAGEPITITYAQSLQNTNSRRSYLERTKHFSCDCRRCADNTECNFYVGSFRCPRCSSLLQSLSPLDLEADWNCRSCQYALRGSDYNAANTALRKELKQHVIIPSLEKFLTKYEEKPLHPTNCHILEAKHSLIQLYGRSQDLSLSALERLQKLCEELLKVSEALDPGQTKLRAELLMEKHNSLSRISFIKAKFKKTKKESENLKKEAAAALLEADQILSAETKIILLS